MGEEIYGQNRLRSSRLIKIVDRLWFRDVAAIGG